MGTEDKLIKMISETYPAKRRIRGDDRLFDLGIDSVKLIDLIIKIESGFGIVFEDSDLNADTFDSVRSVCEKIDERITEKAAV